MRIDKTNARQIQGNFYSPSPEYPVACRNAADLSAGIMAEIPTNRGCGDDQPSPEASARQVSLRQGLLLERYGEATSAHFRLIPCSLLQGASFSFDRCKLSDEEIPEVTYY